MGFGREILRVGRFGGPLLRSGIELFQNGVPAFAQMPRERIHEIVAWMLAQGILWEEQGILGIGRKGEEAYRRRHFLELLSIFLFPPLSKVGRQQHAGPPPLTQRIALDRVVPARPRLRSLQPRWCVLALATPLGCICRGNAPAAFLGA